MPNQDGYAVSKIIRQLNVGNSQSVPIVALTAHVDPARRQKALDSGMNDMLEKPLDEASARLIIEKLVKKSDSQTSPPLVSEEKVIDLELGAQLARGDLKFAKNMLKMFVNEIPAYQRELRQAYESKDWETLRSKAHKLHGGTCFCGVPRLKKATYAIENALAKEKLDKVMLAYEQLMNEIDALLIAYEKLKINEQ